jgi:peptidoglycan hydrolase-like protein with peptidoglycan-binding domain
MARLPIPFSNPRTYAGHSGVDYAQPRGTIFRASGPGRVTTRSRNDRGGFYVWVQYDNGPLVGYHHMDSHNGTPFVGARVAEGTQLGFVGNTGNSTGPHLHSEVAGHATTAGYWQFFDPGRVVGGGSTAGGSTSGGGQWSDTKKQQFLVSIGLDTGGVGNGWGPASDAATRSFQNSVGLPVDGVFGPNTTSVAQVIEAGKNVTGRSVQEIQSKVGTAADGQWGPKTSLAVYRWQKANGLDADAIWGPASDSKAFAAVTPPPSTGAPAFPLPAHQWFGPEAGGDNSISGWHSHNGDLKVWQQRMIDRGWDLGPDGADGYYGPKGQTDPAASYTGRAAKAFQAEKGLEVDGKIGPATWGAAWTAPVTPPLNPPPTPPPQTPPPAPAPPSSIGGSTPASRT